MEKNPQMINSFFIQFALPYHVNMEATNRGYPTKRALSAMRKHGG